MDNNGIVARGLTRVALWLASLGFHLIPIHTVVQGVCTCGNTQCSSPGKHPRTRNGSKNATSAVAQIVQWFDVDFPESNVGIATGAATGIVVLDVDTRHGGEASLAALETQHGEFPPTPTSRTGGGGLHFFFRHPGGTIRNSAGALGAGLDVRGEGGFVVAPPSVHASGASYEWLPGRAPDQVPLVPIPPWLLDAMQGSKPNEVNGRNVRLRTPMRDLTSNGAAEGERNESVARVFGHLLGHNVDARVAADLTRAWNRDRNRPTLSDAEVEGVLESIAGAELRRRTGGNAHG
jgi:hypothetical protein